jgi:hypothetical protein
MTNMACSASECREHRTAVPTVPRPMAPRNLQGLNVVEQPDDAVSTVQDLLSAPQFPELDLWTNFAFESADEPLLRSANLPSESDFAEDDTIVSPDGVALSDSHANVVAAADTPGDPSLTQLLAGFRVDPFAVPNEQASSLARLLALHPSVLFTSLPSPIPALPSTRSNPVTPQQPESSTPPQVKRLRTRKVSTSTVDEGDSPTPLSVAEDKRRRNTAASARFRLKKKEREAALEARARELESKVNELERECEGLRRENGWLKGLVVGVTGAAQQQPTLAK